LKTNVRMAAGRALLLQLLAIKSNEEKEKGENNDNLSPTDHENKQFDQLNTIVEDEDEDKDDARSLLSRQSPQSTKQEMKGEIDIVIETTLSRNTMYQTASNFLSQDKVFIEREAELASLVTNRIEHRVLYYIYLFFEFIVSKVLFL